MSVCRQQRWNIVKLHKNWRFIFSTSAVCFQLILCKYSSFYVIKRFLYIYIENENVYKIWWYLNFIQQLNTFQYIWLSLLLYCWNHFVFSNFSLILNGIQIVTFVWKCWGLNSRLEKSREDVTKAWWGWCSGRGDVSSECGWLWVEHVH